LMGLYDADGSADVNGVSFSTRFEKLAEDIQLALLRYGIMSTIVKGLAGFNFVEAGRMRYEVRISDSISVANFQKFIGFRFAFKKERLASLAARQKRDQNNFLPVAVNLMRSLGVNRVQYIKNHEQNRPYTRNKLATLELPELDQYKQYHWDRV